METPEEKLVSVLSSQLNDGHAELETLSNGHVCGFVVSSEFREKDYHERRQRIREVLEHSLTPDELAQVSTLLSYAPEEWSIQLENSE